MQSWAWWRVSWWSLLQKTGMGQVETRDQCSFSVKQYIKMIDDGGRCGRLWWPKAKGREEKKETGGDVVEWQQNKEMSSIGGHCRYLPSSPALLWAQETRISDVLCATEKSVHLSFSFSFAQKPTFSPGGTGSWELIRVAWKDTSGGEWSDCVKSVWRGRLIEDSTTGFLHNSSSQWNKWLWLWGFQETDAKCQNQEKYATETPHRKHLHCYFPPLIHSPVETVMTTIL